MIKFCEEHNEIPEDPDTAFILAYDHSPINETDEPTEEMNAFDDAFDDVFDDEINEADEANLSNEVMPWIRFIATTKRFLLNSAKSKNICADSTKKLVVQKYPVLVFGATDFDSTQHFHLLAVMVSKYETAADFEFGFKAIRDGMQRILNQEFNVKILMRDAAFAIHNGFVSVFGEDSKSLMCYVHVARAIDRRPMGRSINKDAIKKDIGHLRLAYDEKMFRVGCELFAAKWQSNEPDFVQYFDDTWVKHNSLWYNGACDRMVKTNNGLECWNGNLKKYHSHWKITGLNKFKVDLLDILSKESREYIRDKLPYKSDITISNNMRKEGWNLSKTKSIIRRKGTDGKGRCYIRQGASLEQLTQANFNHLMNMSNICLTFML